MSIGGWKTLRIAQAVAGVSVVAGLVGGCSSGHLPPHQAARATVQRGAPASRTGHWQQVSFQYPATWTLRDFKTPSFGPVTLGPFLADRPLHDPCANGNACGGPPISVPATAGTVWAQWTTSVLETPGKPGTSKITVRNSDDGQMCPDVGTPLGSFTADWTTEPTRAYRLQACYTRADAVSTVATLRRIAASVSIGPSSSVCSPSNWRAVASKASPYLPGGGVRQLSTHISVAVRQGQCRLPFVPTVQLVNRGRPVGSPSVLSPLATRTTRLVKAGETFQFLVVWTPGSDARCRSASTVTAVRIELPGSQKRAAVTLPAPSTLCRLDTVYVTYPR